MNTLTHFTPVRYEKNLQPIAVGHSVYFVPGFLDSAAFDYWITNRDEPKLKKKVAVVVKQLQNLVCAQPVTVLKLYEQGAIWAEVQTGTGIRSIMAIFLDGTPWRANK